MTTAATARVGPETTGTAPRRTHFPGFESLRAAAAVMVVVHHASSYAGAARTGPIRTLAEIMDSGVAVFFVLSGFLIYRPFVTAALDGRAPQRAASFWWRRLLRIVPAYWVVLTFFWAIGSFRLGDDWWRYYLFLQIYSRETVLGGVVQAWSLATEMSFYLLIPLWALVLRQLARGRSTGAIAAIHLAGCALLWLAGPVSRVVVEAWAPSYRGLAFNWLPSNLDLFATGMGLAALSALAEHRPALRTRLDRLGGPVAVWWAAGAALFVWYAYAIGPPESFAVGYEGWFWHRRQFVLAAFSALIMVPAVFGDQASGLLRRAWSWTPLVWVGTVSYGLYLWHFDWMKRSIAGVDGFGTQTWPGWVRTPPGDSSFWWLLAVGMGVGLLFAAVSWYLLEKPLQRWKDLPGALGRRDGQR